MKALARGQELLMEICPAPEVRRVLLQTKICEQAIHETEGGQGDSTATPHCVRIQPARGAHDTE